MRPVPLDDDNNNHDLRDVVHYNQDHEQHDNDNSRAMLGRLPVYVVRQLGALRRDHV